MVSTKANPKPGFKPQPSLGERAELQQNRRVHPTLSLTPTLNPYQAKALPGKKELEEQREFAKTKLIRECAGALKAGP